MKNFYFLLSLTFILSAAYERITTNEAAHPILVFGAIAGVIYIAIDIFTTLEARKHNVYK